MIARLVLNNACALVCAASASAAPVEWPVASGGNGHWYEHVPGETSWSVARDLAAARVHLGLPGHLATIGSAAEEQFITASLGLVGEPEHWIGGFQPAGSAEPDGNWQWITGEPWAYVHWRGPGEPSNSGGNEQVLQLHGSMLGWNDNSDLPRAVGYIVEFEAPPPPPCPGDANDDGLVNFADVTSVLTNFGATYGGSGPGDANGNGLVNFADITEVLVAFGQSCP